MTPKGWITGLAACCATVMAGQAAAAPTCNNPAILHFPTLFRGGSSAVVERRDNVSTDKTACYRLNIHGGSRTLTVHLFSDDPAGFLQIYSPNWTANRVDHAWAFTGPALPGAAEADHATKWKGAAPIGNVLIVVTMPGAGRQYRLRVEAQ